MITGVTWPCMMHFFVKRQSFFLRVEKNEKFIKKIQSLTNCVSWSIDNAWSEFHGKNCSAVDFWPKIWICADFAHMPQHGWVSFLAARTSAHRKFLVWHAKRVPLGHPQLLLCGAKRRQAMWFSPNFQRGFSNFYCVVAYKFCIIFIFFSDRHVPKRMVLASLLGQSLQPINRASWLAVVVLACPIL